MGVAVLQHLRLLVRVADGCVGEPPGDSSMDSPLSLDVGCRFAIMLHIMENTCSRGVFWLPCMAAGGESLSVC
jgi:hypothetical protein